LYRYRGLTAFEALSDDGQCIEIKIIGDGTSQRALEAAIEAHRLGRRLSIRRFLCDFTEFRNIGSVSDNYSAAYHGAREGPDIDDSARVAVVTSPGDRSHDFAEVVARNSGQNLKVFTDRTAAVMHLLGD
jgi:hypothetical protein